jgi:hypothetical protein
MWPCVVSASKSGAVLPIKSGMVLLLIFGEQYVAPGALPLKDGIGARHEERGKPFPIQRPRRTKIPVAK